LFAQVFRETKERFVFQMRGLCIAQDGLRFYIKPEEGLQLPAIMKWLKQVFAQRYNRAQGREGHIWGDRYGSRILAEEPPATPPVGLAGVGEEDSGTGVRPRYGEPPLQSTFPLLFQLLLVPSPG
ncbi:MAG: transposase, partial [Spirochaetaceae bacterium]|nr:transposase [Spirochaetaceae bacterium]